jgi:peptidoglycan/LPS O-acetylase OafA/YrhL
MRAEPAQLPCPGSTAWGSDGAVPHRRRTTVTPVTAPTLPRRPGLDGVRALAVAAVLLHHARVPGFAGGYLGVDVFFVLSGFLITSLLLREADGAGRIDLKRFWARRARRLLPALFAVLLAVAAYGAWLAPGTTRARLGGDALATLAYVANWRFVVDGTSYFEQYADPSPLLHTWSLAVEEQFYLVWPLIVVLAVRLRRRPLEHSGWAWASVATAILVSAVLAVTLTPAGAEPARAYYGTDVRAQELLVGVLLALWAASSRLWSPDAVATARAMGRAAAEVAGITGLAGVVLAVAVAGDARRFLHAGGLLAVSVAAAALVAAAVSPRRTLVRRLLELPPLVGLGAISYGVYLWHWPLFVVLTPARTGLHDAPLAVLRIAVTLVVALASYRLLERPVRRADLRRLDPATRVLLMPAAALTTLAAVAVATSVSAPPPRLEPVAVSAPGSGAAGAAAAGAGAAGSAVSVFVLGDSTAWLLHHEYPTATSSGFTVTGSTQLGCDLLGGSLVIDGRPQAEPPICANWTATWQQGVAAARPDVAVLVAGNGFLFDRDVDGRRVRFGTPEYRDLLRAFLGRTIAGLKAAARRVVVTDMLCFAKPDTGLDDTAGVIDDVARQRAFNDLLAGLLQPYRDVGLLDLRSYTCPHDQYRSRIGDVSLQVDGVHWTPGGAALVWAWLEPRLRA